MTETTEAAKNWNKLATSVKRVNNPLLPDHYGNGPTNDHNGFEGQRLEDNRRFSDDESNNKTKNTKNDTTKSVESAGPAVGILIDLFEKNRSDECKVLSSMYTFNLIIT